MVRTPDAFPGDRYDEGIVFDNLESGSIPPEGGVRYVDGSFLLTDDTGTLNPRKLQVSNTDAVQGFLRDKLIQGSNVAIQTINSGSNELLEISASSSSGYLAQSLSLSSTSSTNSSGITKVSLTQEYEPGIYNVGFHMVGRCNGNYRRWRMALYHGLTRISEITYTSITANMNETFSGIFAFNFDGSNTVSLRYNMVDTWGGSVTVENASLSAWRLI